MDVAGLTVEQNLRLACAEIVSREARYSVNEIIERSEHLARWVMQNDAAPSPRKLDPEVIGMGGADSQGLGRSYKC